MSEGDDAHNKRSSHLYSEQFDADADKGDLELAGLDKAQVDRREERLRGVKACLSEWRPVTLLLAQLLQWQRPWFPALLLGLNSLFFLLVWLLDLSVLSTLALLGVVVTLADAIVPVVSATIFDANAWTDEQERELDAVCGRILDSREQAETLWANLKRLKASLPRSFSLALCGLLVVLAILFDKINNALLLYILTSALLLTPGLLARKVPQLARQHGAQLLHKLKKTKPAKQH
ncbi:ADP-ribosylation factor-like protein 6-interacting protein 1 [Paramacrobiotus metropolitanus]|uniref:ADP-ribosylation factor-like protein 6-interacting protein 1 n=1 Tax=Paramacrobiotus metropolitanus TaxID=2943436 RepID=UPI0024456872|nr:ADP-ribosylation factor-like protein 6-interacting protein 1 [Paramacrobiotus metropolitanus]XP_055353087.1 ADP-ribosylation factor-like protein 6-interacting protein 1 [Paramacrobiotus metropolitanus]